MTDKPKTKIQNLTFWPVPEFEDADVAFGTGREHYFNRGNLPKIPNKYEELAQELFFKGGRLPDFHPSVDRKKATRAITAWLKSFAPAHEEKIATASYGLWVWCEGLGEEK